MERADILDRLMVLAALTFFLLVVAYILKQRVFDKGLSLIGFFWRLGGLRKGRSVADVKQKLELASQAAKATNWALEEAKSQTSTSLKDAAQLVATSVATAAAAALSHTPTPAAETIVFVNEDEEIAAFDPSADEEQGEGEEREMEEAPEEQEEAPEPDRARTRQNTRPTVVHSEL